MHRIRSATAVLLAALVGLTPSVSFATDPDRGTLRDMFDRAAEYSDNGDSLRAIIVHDLMLRAFSRTGNRKAIQAVCKNLTSSVPAEDVEHFNLSFWQCAEDELTDWLGSIEDYRSIEPVLIRATRPRFPPRTDIPEGFVDLSFDISATGEVENIDVNVSSSPVWESLAIEALEQWKYSPARFEGKPVRKAGMTQRITFRFEQ